MHPTYSAVQARLLEANRLSPELLAKSLCIIGAHHVDYADIYCQRTAYESWHLEEGIVKSGSFQINQGVGVRAVSGDKTAFAYADSLLHRFDKPFRPRRPRDWGGRRQGVRQNAV
ncbi:TLDD protein-like protein [Neisseria meningitidis]|nr:TLDD protein-like protein [Neisseria meningitidis]